MAAGSAVQGSTRDSLERQKQRIFASWYSLRGDQTHLGIASTGNALFDSEAWERLGDRVLAAHGGMYRPSLELPGWAIPDLASSEACATASPPRVAACMSNL